MNTRIEKDFLFQTGLHFDGKFHINVYEVSLSMLVETNSNWEQNVAMDRITYFLREVIQNSVLVNFTDHEAIQKYKAAGMHVCEIPEDPFDQIFGMTLLLKLNSIMENRLKITDMVLGSSLSDGVRYTIVNEAAENLLSGDFWWSKPCPGTCNQVASLDGDNIVRLFDDSDWVSLGLTWKERSQDNY